MGSFRSATCFSLLVAVHAVYVLQVVGASTGQCDNVFKGFSDCLLELGDHMAHYPEELDERENLRKICTYWDDFHSCALTALADCQEGAAELWARLRKDSRRLDFQASLFELCAGPNRASGSKPGRLVLLLLPALPTLLNRVLF